MLEIPTQDYRRSHFRGAPSPPRGLDAAVNRALGRFKRRSFVLNKIRDQAWQALGLESEMAALTDAALRKRLLESRETFRRRGMVGEVHLLSALAAMREASDRVLGLRPFPVQLMGALTLHRGCLAEMATGEGKTLTAGLAAVLMGWTRLPCHVITVNDYLVQRDARWLEPFYHYCGIRVGYVDASQGPAERLKNYGCDVTYVTSKELLADFLRDRLAFGKMQHPTRRLIRHMLMPKQRADGLVLRGLHSAIVDEADSILIDEAVTPLIIAAPHENPCLREATRLARDLAQNLQSGRDYQADPRHKEIELTREGTGKLVEEASRLPGLWKGRDRRLELVVQALVAREFFHCGSQYIIENNQVVIVDEFTGRPMPQRTWREGMHQAIEAKENLSITDPSETIARLSFQRFFRCFERLAGMTGTASEAADEFWHIYGLATLRIPPNRPCIRQHWPDRYFRDEKSKVAAALLEIERLHGIGRPVLVGTRSVNASEQLWKALTDRGHQARLLNAARLDEEAATVALAGERGRITIATNMAGRGTDIKLGSGVADLGGLHVLALERFESGRVDRQLYGRSARQGDPGTAQAFVSAEDELPRKYLNPTLRGLFQGMCESNVPGSLHVCSFLIHQAQAKAQNAAFKQRQDVMRADVWMDQALSFAGNPFG